MAAINRCNEPNTRDRSTPLKTQMLRPKPARMKIQPNHRMPRGMKKPAAWIPHPYITHQIRTTACFDASASPQLNISAAITAPARNGGVNACAMRRVGADQNASDSLKACLRNSKMEQVSANSAVFVQTMTNAR